MKDENPNQLSFRGIKRDGKCSNVVKSVTRGGRHIMWSVNGPLGLSWSDDKACSVMDLVNWTSVVCRELLLSVLNTQIEQLVSGECVRRWRPWRHQSGREPRNKRLRKLCEGHPNYLHRPIPLTTPAGLLVWLSLKPDVACGTRPPRQWFIPTSLNIS